MTPRYILTVCTLALTLLTGCVQTDEDGGTEHRLSGAFTEATTSQDLDTLRDKLAPYEVNLMVMESFPMQYQVVGIDGEDCEAIRALLEDEPYVATVGPCTPVTETTGGATATSDA